MANKLFRQQAMDTLESPDKINDYIRVAGPSFYLMLVSILICVGVAFFWIFNNTWSNAFFYTIFNFNSFLTSYNFI